MIDPQIQQYIQNHPLIFTALLIWSLIIKGFALWRAGNNGERNWFIALFLLNTAGILDLLYLSYFSGNKNRTEAR